MAYNPQAVVDVLVSHAAASGHFERVNSHEPKNAPGLGLTCAIWADRIDPVRSSGLDSVSTRVTYNIRVQCPMTREPQDSIDTDVLNAVSALFSAYIGDFELGGEARHIDILGAYGQALMARAGYLDIDRTLYRIVVVTLPVIFNDVYTEAP